MAYGIVATQGVASGSGSSGGIFLADVSNATAVAASKKVSLTWTDPEDVTYGGAVLAGWVSTTVVRKEGSAPTSRTDGTVVLTSNTRNAYSETPFVDSGLTNGKTYFYKFFPLAHNGNYTESVAVSGKPAPTTVQIPAVTSSHTYTGNAQSPTLSNFNDTFMEKTSDTTKTDAGSYTIKIRLMDDDHIWSDGTYTDKDLPWTINPEELTVPTVSGTKTYTGNAQSPTLNNYVSAKMTQSSDTSKTDAGSYTLVVGLASTNYKFSGRDASVRSVSLPWTIEPEALAVPTVSGSLTYNGNAQSPTVNNFVSAKMSKSSDTSKTNAGNYTIRVTLASTNYKFSGKDASVRYVDLGWSIGKATGSVTLNKNTATLTSTATSTTATITKTGDGTLSVSSSNASLVTGSINGTTLTVTKAGNTNGTVTITVSSSATTNYTAASAQITVTVQSYKIMTVKIDQSNSNPATCCTYADDAVNMTAGSSAWDEWFGEYPVMLKNGVEGKKLNPNDYTKHTDGTAADITSGNEGDVMVAFPRRGLRISTSGDVVTVSMTDNPNDSSFKYYAHQRGTTNKDVFYLGAYKGYVADNKLRSLSGKTITGSITIGTARNYARANSPASNGSGGSGYDQSGWFQLIFRQAMYCLKYKNLDSQAVLGKGITSGGKQNTGGTNANGLNYGDTTNTTTHVKCFGIEDMWGNIFEWIDGLYADSSRNILTATQNFNDTGSNYTNQGKGATSDFGGWASKVQGTSETGFITKASSGSATTYFCDEGGLRGSCLPFFGGDYFRNGDNAGVFCLDVQNSAAFSYSSLGARLMYL